MAYIGFICYAILKASLSLSVLLSASPRALISTGSSLTPGIPYSFLLFLISTRLSVSSARLISFFWNSSFSLYGSFLSYCLCFYSTFTVVAYQWASALSVAVTFRPISVSLTSLRFSPSNSLNLFKFCRTFDGGYFIAAGIGSIVPRSVAGTAEKLGTWQNW